MISPKLAVQLHLNWLWQPRAQVRQLVFAGPHGAWEKESTCVWMGEPALRERIAASSGWQVTLGGPIKAVGLQFSPMFFTVHSFSATKSSELSSSTSCSCHMALRSKQLGRGQYGTAYLVTWDEEKCGEERKDQYKSGEQAQ